jgi:hypothetical protein
MPLYEAIVLTKAGTARGSVEVFRTIIKHIHEYHPYARVLDATNLGDRILATPIKRRGVTHEIGRYLQLLYQGSPAVFPTIKQACDSEGIKQDVFMYHHNRLKDSELERYMNFKAMQQTWEFTDETDRDWKYLADYSKLMAGQNRN